MRSSRRTFLKNSAVAGATVALGALPGSSAILQDDGSCTAVEPLTDSPSSAPGATAKAFTRGLGIYPGDPRDDFSPKTVIDNSRYRNLALLRPAYHSSSYDYNLTAQLVTDGIKATHLPQWVVVSDQRSRGPLPKTEREVVLDHSPMNTTGSDGRDRAN